MSSTLREMRMRLEEAFGITEAANACARAGQTGRAVDIANDVDDPIHDAERLLTLALDEARSSGRRRIEKPGSDVAPSPEAVLAQQTIKQLLVQASEQMRKAVGVARAAELRAETSNLNTGVQLAMSVEPLLYDVKHCINAASIVNRLSAQREESAGET